MPQTTMDLVNCIPHYGAMPSRAGAIYSTVVLEHLHGFRPVACYGMQVDPLAHDINLLKQSRRGKKGAPRRHHVAWLLLEREGTYYVDRISGLDRRGYGVDPRAPRLDDVLLPPECYDVFHHHANREGSDLG